MKSRIVPRVNPLIDYEGWLDRVDIALSEGETISVLTRLLNMTGQTEIPKNILAFLITRISYAGKIVFTFDSSYTGNCLGVNFNGVISYTDRNGLKHTEINLGVPGKIERQLIDINKLYSNIYIALPTLDFQDSSPEFAYIIESLIHKINTKHGYPDGTRPCIPLKDGRIIPIHTTINMYNIHNMNTWEKFAIRPDR